MLNIGLLSMEQQLLFLYPHHQHIVHQVVKVKFSYINFYNKNILT